MKNPERLDRFMARAADAYYATHDPYNDFVTAPELTQAVGEVLGAWCAVVWAQLGRPDPVLLVEAGPGRGTLMADARRILRRVAPDFIAASRLHLIERSPRLRNIQAAALPDALFHDEAAGLPAGPMLLIANEFLDALPIRQLVRRDGVWLERFVADGAFVEQPAAPVGVVAADGAVLELGEAAAAWVAMVAGRIVEEGGVALVLDYGHAGGLGDTLQGLRAGQPADALAAPAETDITAHVDFLALGSAARAAGACVHGPVPQGAFLAALGVRERMARLAAAAPDRAAGLRAAEDRLLSPAGMGVLFQALAIGQRGTPSPPGFA